MAKLLLLFTVVPLLELYLLLKLADRIGTATTVAIVLITGFVGAAMARAEGVRVYLSWQRAIARGHVPEDGVVSGLLVLVGGVLLVTPGVLTDVLGFALLLPLTRRPIAVLLTRQIQRAIERGTITVVRRGPPAGPAATSRSAPDKPGDRPVAPPDVIDTTGEVVEPER